MAKCQIAPMSLISLQIAACADSCVVLALLQLLTLPAAAMVAAAAGAAGAAAAAAVREGAGPEATSPPSSAAGPGADTVVDWPEALPAGDRAGGNMVQGNTTSPLSERSRKMVSPTASCSKIRQNAHRQHRCRARPQPFPEPAALHKLLPACCQARLSISASGAHL